jgi:hypothetical protein
LDTPRDIRGAGDHSLMRKTARRTIYDPFQAGAERDS